MPCTNRANTRLPKNTPARTERKYPTFIVITAIMLLNVSEKTIRLIDTPGIGDCRGADQDALNFSAILRYIANIPEIHGICILLKPNNSRMNIVFKYCINELLTHLHVSAAQNIAFCFTNARSTFYR